MSAMTDATSTATTTRSRPVVSSTSHLRAGQDPLSLPKGTTAAPAYARVARGGGGPDQSAAVSTRSTAASKSRPLRSASADDSISASARPSAFTTSASNDISR